jgi:hypothetical protein
MDRAKPSIETELHPDQLDVYDVLDEIETHPGPMAKPKSVHAQARPLSVKEIVARRLSQRTD